MEILIKKIHAKTSILATGSDVYLAALIIIHALGHTVPWYLWALFGLELGCSFVMAAAFKRENGESIAS